AWTLNPLYRRRRDDSNAVTAVGELFGNRRRRCLLTLKQSLPNGINAGAQSGNPPHAGDCQTPASHVRGNLGEGGNLRISTDAFVPPNPNEFESAVFTTAGRASFATMLTATSSSGVVKLMLAGRNWC